MTSALVRDTLAATAAMTASQHLEMRLTRRPPSGLPVDVVGRVLGREITGAAPRAVVGHVAQGSLAATAVLGARVLGRRVRTVGVLTAGLVLGDAALATAVGVAPPPWRWSGADIARDVLHKGVLAAAAVALSRAC